MKETFKIIFVIIGAIIGAGFASGKEIYTFFCIYGYYGIIGILISSFLFGLIIYKVFQILDRYNINEYNNFLKIILKERKSDKINKVIYLIISAFLLITFYIMIAGFGAYFNQKYNVPVIIGAGIFSIFIFITLNRNIEGIIKISEIVVPIIILFIIMVGVKEIEEITVEEIRFTCINKSVLESIISGVLYSSYNSIILIPAIVPLKKYIKKENIKIIGMVVGILLAILSFIIYIILQKNGIEIGQYDLPMIYIMKLLGNIYEKIYGIVIIVAIFTSVISAGYGFLENISKNKKSYTQILSIMCITSPVFAFIGFSKLINILYPMFGVLGIIQIYFILKRKI